MTEILAADAAGISRAATLLLQGALVAFPTETVYGLGAVATDAHAVAAIFAAKGRPSFNPLICHFASAEPAFAETRPTPLAEALAAAFWPGALTLVLPRNASTRIDPLVSAGLPSLAVRVPGHPVALALLREAGAPIAAPSANRSGKISPTCAGHVLADLRAGLAAVLDGGATGIGLESTVVDLTGPAPRLLRPGGVATRAIEAITGKLARPGAGGAGDEARSSPGLLLSHYAPDLKLRTNASEVADDEALLAFGVPLSGGAAIWNLSAGGDLTEAAARLFAGLRALDEAGRRLGLSGIAAMKIPRTGLGEAINDRLSRARVRLG